MGKLVLIRHGESLWNLKNVFTGWVDVPLSSNGIEEAIEAGRKLSGIPFDIVFTSVQIRAIQTAMTLLAVSQDQKTPVIMHTEGKMADWTGIYSSKMHENILPVYRDWHLNERYYGELQGKNKSETAAEFGDEQVRLWRRSYDVPPPGGECLKDTAERTIPFFKERILKMVKEGMNVLVSAHGNSLRSIVMYLENISEKDIPNLEIPTGFPIIYEYEQGELRKKDL